MISIFALNFVCVLCDVYTCREPGCVWKNIILQFDWNFYVCVANGKINRTIFFKLIIMLCEIFDLLFNRY